MPAHGTGARARGVNKDDVEQSCELLGQVLTGKVTRIKLQARHVGGEPSAHHPLGGKLGLVLNGIDANDARTSSRTQGTRLKQHGLGASTLPHLEHMHAGCHTHATRHVLGREVRNNDVNVLDQP